MPDRQQRELAAAVADLGKRAVAADRRGDTKEADRLCRQINRTIAFYD